MNKSLRICPRFNGLVDYLNSKTPSHPNRFKMAQPKKLLDGLKKKKILNWQSRVKNKFFRSQNHIFRHCFIEETLNCNFPKPLKLLTYFQDWEHGLSIRYHLELNLHMCCCYTLYVWDFCLHQPLLVMRSRGEPLSTTVKVVTPQR